MDDTQHQTPQWPLNALSRLEIEMIKNGLCVTALWLAMSSVGAAELTIYRCEVYDALGAFTESFSVIYETRQRPFQYQDWSGIIRTVYSMRGLPFNPDGTPKELEFGTNVYLWAQYGIDFFYNPANDRSVIAVTYNQHILRNGIVTNLPTASDLNNATYVDAQIANEWLGAELFAAEEGTAVFISASAVSHKPGDSTGDGRTTFADFLILQRNYQQSR